MRLSGFQGGGHGGAGGLTPPELLWSVEIQDSGCASVGGDPCCCPKTKMGSGVGVDPERLVLVLVAAVAQGGGGGSRGGGGSGGGQGTSKARPLEWGRALASQAVTAAGSWSPLPARRREGYGSWSPRWSQELLFVAWGGAGGSSMACQRYALHSPPIRAAGGRGGGGGGLP